MNQNIATLKHMLLGLEKMILNRFTGIWRLSTRAVIKFITYAPRGDIQLQNSIIEWAVTLFTIIIRPHFVYFSTFAKIFKGISLKTKITR